MAVFNDKQPSLATSEDRYEASLQADAKAETATLEYAQYATRLQHQHTLKDAFRLYMPAIGWSFLFSLGVVQAGFDPQLIGSLVAIPTF